jgi:hypothetical protein
MANLRCHNQLRVAALLRQIVSRFVSRRISEIFGIDNKVSAIDTDECPGSIIKVVD